jgi:hypothetical protein
MAAKIYISAATASVNSDKFQIRTCDIPTSISASGLSGTETVDLQITHDDGSNWFDAYYCGNKVQLTATNNQTILLGPGTFRFSKGATLSAVTAAVATDRLGL